MAEAKSLPNRKLREVREQYGWSQQDVADKVGTTPLNVGRWERGVTQPSPYYRQKLCTIFEKTVQELGMVQEHIQPEKGPEVSTALSPLWEGFTQFWNVPYSRNLFFTGREDILTHLHDVFLLRQSTNPIQPQAISGLGGIGKTQTAVEYAYRYREYYEAVLWARADSTELLNTDFLLIAALLNLPQRHEHDQDLAVKAVLHWFNAHDRWLLILDNADRLETVSTYIPMIGKGHVLLTTRVHSTGTVAQRVELDTMDVQQGTAFLLRRAGLFPSISSLEASDELIRSQAQKIVEALDGLPLALDQAGAYIEETGCSLSDYLSFYQSRRMRLLRVRGENTTGHPEPVAMTWSLAFEKVEHTHPAAAELLRLCAFLHPDGIPESMIIDGASELGPILQTVATDAFELNEAIGELRKYSLLKRVPEKKHVNIHRLVQAVLRESMNEETQQKWAEQTVRMMSRVFPDPRHWLSEDWLRCQVYLPHVHSCLDLIAQRKILSAEAIQLLLRTGSYYIEQAHYQDAEHLTQQALTMSEQLFGADDPEVAHSLEQLAWIYFRQREGKAKLAESFYERAIALYEQAFGPHHPATAECYNDLAVLYAELGKYEQAEHHHQRALSIREHLFGSDHPQVGESLYNMGFLYFYQEKYEQTEQLNQRALAIYQKMSGNELIVSSILGRLGTVYREQGKYEQAESYLQQSISLAKQVCGVDHIYSQQMMTDLGVLYREQGEYEQAEALFQQVVKSQEQDHALTSNWESALKALGVLYYRQGKYEQAERLLHRFLTDFQQELDIHIRAHEQWTFFFSEIIECLNTLALLYLEQGKYEIAEHYHQQALVLFQQGLSANDMFKMKREKEMLTFEADTGIVATKNSIQGNRI